MQTLIRAGTLQGRPGGPRPCRCRLEPGTALASFRLILSSGRERSSLFPFQCRKEDSEISSYCPSSHSKRLGSAEPSWAPRLPQPPEDERCVVGAAAKNKGGIGPPGPLDPLPGPVELSRAQPCCLSLGRSCPPAELPLSFRPAPPALSPRAWPRGSHRVLCGSSPVCSLLRPPGGALTTRPLPAPARLDHGLGK